MTKEAMKQALEALETCTPQDTSTSHVIHAWHDEELVDKAIKALEEALKQEQAEPVAWRVKVDVKLSDGKVSTTYQLRNTKLSEFDEPLYTKPQPSQKPWVGLTDEQIKKVWGIHDDDDDPTNIVYERDITRAIEAKLKEKNT